MTAAAKVELKKNADELTDNILMDSRVTGMTAAPMQPTKYGLEYALTVEGKWHCQKTSGINRRRGPNDSRIEIGTCPFVITIVK